MNSGIPMLFLQLIAESVRSFTSPSGRHSPPLKFDPALFVCDGQGSLWIALRLHFEGSSDDLDGREQTCMFHLKRGLRRLLLVFTSDHLLAPREDFRVLVERLISETDLSTVSFLAYRRSLTSCLKSHLLIPETGPRTLFPKKHLRNDSK